MYDIETTSEFDHWLANIKDSKTQKVIVILLCGGDKRTQKADIKNARTMAKEI